MLQNAYLAGDFYKVCSAQYSKVAMILKGAFLFSRNPRNNALDPGEVFVLNSSCLELTHVFIFCSQLAAA